ncbi:MAG: hypothetical protein CSA32_05650 [Desulfobulbus propionicus]|nr:MAG: hypothetical protein CSA32_05650 [Desulfobulbus propionicus]
MLTLVSPASPLCRLSGCPGPGKGGWQLQSLAAADRDRPKMSELRTVVIISDLNEEVNSDCLVLLVLPGTLLERS